MGTTQGSGGTMSTTFVEGEPESKPIRYATGQTLRREYLLNKRQEYISTQDPDYIFTDREKERFYPDWKLQAEKAYPDEGDYIINTETGVATYQGEL